MSAWRCYGSATSESSFLSSLNIPFDQVLHQTINFPSCVFVSLQLQEWLCTLCMKRRQVILSSGMWFHGQPAGTDLPVLITDQQLMVGSNLLQTYGLKRWPVTSKWFLVSGCQLGAVADPGFPRGRVPTTKGERPPIIWLYFPDKCMKTKNIWPNGACIPVPTPNSTMCW